MPLTGTFLADFNSFTDACAKAEVSLKGFEGDANKVGSALDKMVNSLSGTKIVQQATIAAQAVDLIGGTAKLTDAELQRMGGIATEAAAKLRAMGEEVPPKIQGIADAAKAAGQSTGSWSSAIGLAGSALSTLGIPASIGAFVALGKAVFTDADALTKMHDQTGITVEGLQALRIGGDDAGVSLESMAGAVTMLQKRLGGDDQSALEALKDLNISVEDFKQLDGAKQMALVSDAVKGIHDPLRVAADLNGLFGKSWAELLPVLKRGFDEMHDGSRQMSTGTVKALDDAGDAVGAFYRAVKVNIGEAIADILTVSTSEWRALKSQIEQLPAVAGVENMKNIWGAIAPPGLPKDLDDITQKLDKEVEASIKAAQATERHQEALLKLTAQYNGDGAIAAASDYEEVLARVGGAENLTIEAKKTFADVFQKVIDQYRLLGPAGVPVVQHFATLLQTIEPIPQKLLDIESGYHGVAGTIESVGQKFKPAMADIEPFLHATKAVGEEWIVNDQAAGHALDTIAQKAQAATQVLYTMNSAFSVGGSAGDMNAAAAARGGTVARDFYGNPYIYIPGVNAAPGLPHFAGGVQNFGGGLAVVGERGPELVNLPAGSSVIPNGAGGSNPIVNIYVNGTAADVARKIKQELTTQLRRGLKL